MSLKVYEYKGCGTCKKALKYLDGRGVEYKKIPIRDQPPSRSELKKMLKIYGGEIRRLFNTSGGDYKALNLKAKLPTMSADAAVELLAANGNLVKRPFVLKGDRGVVGFKEDEWSTLLK